MLGTSSFKPEVRIASRWIPKGSAEIQDRDGLGVCYVSESDGLNGHRWYVMAFRGTAGKHSFYYSYRTAELAQKAVSDFFESLAAHKKIVAESRRERPHSLKVGDIITNSWGYDQTNVDWYRVTRTSDHYVWLKPICSQLTPDGGVGPMSGYVQPSVSTDSEDPASWGFQDAEGEEEKHKATEHGNGNNSVTFPHGCGSKWTGQQMYCSWYA